MMQHRTLLYAGAALVVSSVLVSAAPPQEPASAPAGLTSRRTTAVSYEARRSTKIDMVGTPLMPRSRGEAEIVTEASGPVRIKVKVHDLASPSQLGPEYLAYVFWAIPPQGRPKNLGEMRHQNGESEIEVTADVQTFALVVTAEPYYAVTTPSDVVVMENAVRAETRGNTSMATLQFEIVPRGAYVAAAGASYTLPPLGRNEPPDVQQARNAVVIARIAEAGQFAAAGFATAQGLLAQTEQLVAKKGNKRDIISQSRAAVQAAEEARLQSVRLRAAEQERVTREAGAAREQAARDAAAQEVAARQAADRDRERAQLDQQRAEQVAQVAAREKASADDARRQAESARAEADKARLEADQARAEAEQLRAEAQAQATRADAQRVTAEQEQVALRTTLLRQFGEILDTRDSTRGLIVNVGDVLFETGRFELRPPAREKLARFAGIVLAHAGLVVQAEGFTDSTGTAAINEKLSQQRADAVGQFLLSQGLSGDRVTARGFASSQPVASNDTREGRSQNRRVELVVAGDVIGTPIGTGTTGR